MLVTVRWKSVSRLSPGESMAMAMALAAQQWRQQWGKRDDGSGEGGGVAVAAGRRGEQQQHNG